MVVYAFDNDTIASAARDSLIREYSGAIRVLVIAGKNRIMVQKPNASNN